MSKLKDKIVDILEDHIGSKLTIVENKNDYDDISSEPTGIEEAAQEIVDQLGVGWVDVKDQLPDEGKDILFDTKDSGKYTGTYKDGRFWIYCQCIGGGDYALDVVRWKPLED